MNEASSMLTTENLFDTPNVTSSQELGDGPLPSAQPGGQTTDPYIPGRVLASPSLLQEKNEVQKMRATSGHNSSASSRNVGLQLVLESRLRLLLEGLGSPEYVLTWKSWDMKLGPPICALRASGRRTSDKGSSGSLCPEEISDWRTPSNQESGITLERLVTKEGKPWSPGQRAYDKDTNRLCETGLEQQIQFVGWATPNCDDPNNATRKSGQTRSLTRDAWTCGETPSGINVSMENTGEYRLNPFFSAWMMGYPKVWTYAGLKVATPSRRKSKGGSQSLGGTETQ
jgi:hypothetical protein